MVAELLILVGLTLLAHRTSRSQASPDHGSLRSTTGPGGSLESAEEDTGGIFVDLVKQGADGL